MSDQPNPLAPAVSPLIEADPNSINELIQQRVNDIFNIPPLKRDADGNFVLDDAKLSIAIEYYRKERLRFMSEAATKAATAPRAAKKTVPKSVAEALASTADLL